MSEQLNKHLFHHQHKYKQLVLVIFNPAPKQFANWRHKLFQQPNCQEGCTTATVGIHQTKRPQSISDKVNRNLQVRTKNKKKKKDKPHWESGEGKFHPPTECI